MKRRFTDIEKWYPWFRRLSPKLKLFWIFIHDDCDEVGVWIADFEKASFNTGCKYDIDEIRIAFKERFAVFGDKWWIVDYVELQYKELRLPTDEELAVNPKLKHSPAPRYINLLKAHGLWDLYQSRLLDSQLTPSQPTLNSHEEEEEVEYEEEGEGEEEEEEASESSPNLSSEQDAAPQSASGDAPKMSYDEKKRKARENGQLEGFDIPMSNLNDKQTPFDPIH